MARERVESADQAEPSDITEPVATLFRWELAGGVWQVLGRGDGEVTIGLFSCDAREEMDRFTSGDAQLLAMINKQITSEA